MPKLSAMPTVPNCTNADLFYVVQAGVSNAVTHANMLTTPAGVANRFIQGANRGGYSPAGDFEVLVSAGSAFYVTVGGAVVIQCGVFGNIDIISPTGGYVNIQTGTAAVNITFVGAISIQPAAGQVVTIGYLPANPGDWVVPPTDVLVAIDRLARVVSNFGVTPIP